MNWSINKGYSSEEEIVTDRDLNRYSMSEENNDRSPKDDTKSKHKRMTKIESNQYKIFMCFVVQCLIIFLWEYSQNRSVVQSTNSASAPNFQE
jgi:hypothetical protein